MGEEQQPNLEEILKSDSTTKFTDFEKKERERLKNLDIVLAGILKAVQESGGTWDWPFKEGLRSFEEVFEGDVVFSFPNSEKAAEAYLGIEKAIPSRNQPKFREVYLYTSNQTRDTTKVCIDGTDSSHFRDYLANNLLPRLEKNPLLCEEIYKAATKEGKWDKWDKTDDIDYGPSRVKLKFKDEAARNRTAKKLRNLLAAQGFFVDTNHKQREGMSKRSLIIDGASSRLGTLLRQYFAYRNKQEYIQKRITASKRAASLETDVCKELRTIGVEPLERVKIQGDFCDPLFTAAGDEVDMFSKFSPNAWDGDMEARYNALRQREYHRRTIELDVVAPIGDTAIIGELKGVPEETTSVWAWHARRYASAIHKYVLASGKAMKQVPKPKGQEHGFERVIPVMVVNRDLRSEELRDEDRNIADFQTRTVYKPEKETAKLLERALIELFRHPDEKEFHHTRFPECVAFHRDRARQIALHAWRYRTPVLTVEELAELTEQVKKDGAAEEYTVNDKKVKVHKVRDYHGAPLFHSKRPRHPLTAQGFLNQFEHMATKEGKAHALLTAYENGLLQEPGKLAGQVAYHAVKRDKIRSWEHEPHMNHLAEKIKGMIIPTMRMLRKEGQAYERAVKEGNNELARTIFLEAVERMRSEGQTEAADRLKEAQKYFVNNDYVRPGIALLTEQEEKWMAKAFAQDLGREDLVKDDDNPFPHEKRFERWKLLETAKKCDSHDVWERFAEDLLKDESEGSKYHEMANICMSLGDKQNALKYFLRIPLWKKTNRMGEAYNHTDLTMTLNLASEFRVYDQLVKSDNPYHWFIAALISKNRISLDDTDDATELFKRVVDHYEALGDKGDKDAYKVGASLVKGDVSLRKWIALMSKAGDYSEIASHYEDKKNWKRAEEWWLKTGDIGYIADYYDRRGNNAKALEWYQKSNRYTGKVIAMKYVMGDLDIEKFLEKNIPRLQEKGKEGIAASAVLYEMFGFHEKALPLYEQVGWHLPVFELALATGDSTKAVRTFSDALEHAERKGDFDECAYLCRMNCFRKEAQMYRALTVKFKDGKPLFARQENGDEEFDDLDDF